MQHHGDARQNIENKKQEKEAFKTCEKKIKEHGLDMKLMDVEFKFDKSKILFFFTADGRIDFRELVRDLASAILSIAAVVVYVLLNRGIL